ncbi:MAG TPA: hypothetical protein ENJ43_04415 [Gammaproteobacteria bacterium]|nr:hypothetical protein [Gammaproteobacteria bacterium]
MTKAILSLWLALLCGTLWATVPPPPVNQNMGIPDGVFNDMTFQTCLGCHGDPGNSPAPVNSGYLPDRHHLRIDTPIGDYSASPFPEDSPDGTHKCITCHKVDWIVDPARPGGGYFGFAQDPSSAEFRNCLNCHAQTPGIASVHHLTQKAQEAKCHLCHGSLINDPNDGHYVPDYEISIITPWPGDNYDTTSPSNRFEPPVAAYNGRRKGNCTHCHYSGQDQMTGQLVSSNYETHHGTGVGQPNSGSRHGCDLCHDAEAPNYTIRGCERCHGVSSLHNIEFDKDGDGITPGKEAPFWGHIGSPANCRGCHGNFQGAGVQAILQSEEESTGSANIVPTFSHMRTRGRGMHGGGRMRSAANSPEPRVLTFTGSGFISTVESPDGPVEITARLVLEDRNGIRYEFEPERVTHTLLEVVIPDGFPAGSYDLYLVKGTVRSPVANLVIRPDVTVDQVSCNKGNITVRGSGFSSYLNAEGSGTMLFDSTRQRACTVTSWSDDTIVADCGHDSSGNIRVESIFGSADGNISCGPVNDAGGRPRWWSIWSWWASWSWSRR